MLLYPSLSCHSHLGISSSLTIFSEDLTHLSTPPPSWETSTYTLIICAVCHSLLACLVFITFLYWIVATHSFILILKSYFTPSLVPVMFIRHWFPPNFLFMFSLDLQQPWSKMAISSFHIMNLEAPRVWGFFSVPGGMSYRAGVSAQVCLASKPGTFHHTSLSM